MPEKLKIASWNILSPECLLYFWKSYGLAPLNNSENMADYVSFNKLRYCNIKENLEYYNADVICLQESLVNKISYLDNMTIHEWLAFKLGYVVMGIASKKSVWNMKNEFDMTESYDQCVAILVKKELLAKTEFIDSSENSDGSIHFSRGIGTPYVTIKVGDVYVTTLHVRMDYPKISSLNETIERMKAKCTEDMFKKMIFIGDFNAKTDDANSDIHKINKTHLSDTMDFNTEKSVSDDHLFVGKHLKCNLSHYLQNVLVINPKTDRDVKYNQDIVNKSLCTSDHETLVGYVELCS